MRFEDLTLFNPERDREAWNEQAASHLVKLCLEHPDTPTSVLNAMYEQRMDEARAKLVTHPNAPARVFEENPYESMREDPLKYAQGWNEDRSCNPNFPQRLMNEQVDALTDLLDGGYSFDSGLIMPLVKNPFVPESFVMKAKNFFCDQSLYRVQEWASAPRLPRSYMDEMVDKFCNLYWKGVFITDAMRSIVHGIASNHNLSEMNARHLARCSDHAMLSYLSRNPATPGSILSSMARPSRWANLSSLSNPSTPFLPVSIAYRKAAKARTYKATILASIKHPEMDETIVASRIEEDDYLYPAYSILPHHKLSDEVWSKIQEFFEKDMIGV